MHTLLGYAEIVGLLGAILIGWAIYNQLMYRNKNRRKTPHSVSAKDLAVMYHATPTDVESWQQARVLVMHHDQEGRLIKVDFKTDLAK